MRGVMPTVFLREIADKVEKGHRLTYEEGVLLFRSEHKEAVKALANRAREKKVGNDVLYATTLFIHPTNLCELSCPFCSYYAKPGSKSAWFMTPEQIEEKTKSYLSYDLNEIHFVGGLWRECDLPYYKEAFTRVKNLDADLHIKALTAVEYDFLAKHHKMTLEEVFEEMMSYGLGSLPGGGAEVFNESIRKKLAPQKITSDEFLDVHRRAHKMGLPSNITMLFGSIEEEEHLVEHLCKVRELQDETGGFQTFVPLKYHVENNALGKRSGRLKPKDIEMVYAVSRLMLDNVPHLKVLWNYVGIDEALKVLDCGASDLASTATDEKIIIMAGGIQVKMTGETMASLITQKNRTPRKIHSGQKALQTC